jgi:acyl carrier protein
VSVSAEAALGVLSVEQAVEAVTEALEERPGPPPPIDATTRLDTLGLDSLGYADLFMILEELAGLRLDPDSASDVVVVADLTRLWAL